MPARKTSTIPTRVYKYALKPPTINADLVERTFQDARIYYNQLVTIENRRRHLYRQARSRLFPDYTVLEAQINLATNELQSLRDRVNSSKSSHRSRRVDPTTKRMIADLSSTLKVSREKLRQLRSEISTSPELKLASDNIGQQSSQAIRDLRPTLYWGTYQLCEAAASQASQKSPFEVSYNETPPHLLNSRIGIQFMGGLPASDVSDDTRIQILDPPSFRQTGKNKIWRARYDHDHDGRKIPCRLRLRIGSDNRKPVWAEFPLAMSRPLPADGRLMSAYITRRPLRERNPWQYHLCLVIESRTFERTVPSINQSGTTAINFGWRQLEDGRLRVATINREGETPEFLELPPQYSSGLSYCIRLQSLLDEKFEEIKKKLNSWISSNDCPDGFKDAFDHLPLWKSQHRLNEIVRYWKDHRFPGDESIWPAASAWTGRYLHLHDWMVNQKRRLLAWRDDYYRCFAKKIVTTSASIVVDTCHFGELAKRPSAEVAVTGSQTARYNRTVASPGDLRLKILQAAAKYHCNVIAAPTINGTKRCNVCGTLQVVKSLEHSCTCCTSLWDQDVNNTDNLHEAATSGKVVPLLVPAETTEKHEFKRSESTTYRTARRALRK